MLVYVFACVLLLAPLLQTVFDLPLQLAFQQAVLLAFLAWCGFPYSRGESLLPVFGKRFWGLWAAAAFSMLALLVSPFKGYIFNEWGNYAAGLLIFIVSSFLNKEERSKTDGALAAGAWLVFALVIAQIFILKNISQNPPLTNFNALALYCLMVLPLALARKAWLLAAAMAALVVISQSAGGALAGFGAAGIYSAGRWFRGRGGTGNKLFFAGMVVSAAGVLYVLQAESMAGRLAWWHSAWHMFAARPVTGFGYASFTWAQAGFQAAGAFREHSIYAHNYYLEYMAENGLPAAAIWFAFLFYAVRARKGLVKYSVIAALLHSFVDFGLAVPANFWLFCYLAASPCEDVPGQPAAPRWGGRLLPAKAVLLLILLLEGALLSLNFKSLAFEKARLRAVSAALSRGRAAAQEQLRPYLAGRLFRGPALEYLGSLTIAGPANSDKDFSSAVYYEMALLENPYSSPAWRALERIYGAPGREGAAADLAARKARVYK